MTINPAAPQLPARFSLLPHGALASVAASRPPRAQPATWTPSRDADLRAARADGLSWSEIATRLGVSKWSAIERGRKLGVPRRVFTPRPSEEDPARQPLPAGHSSSWGALTDGTLLHGVPYPMPVFR